MRKKTKTKQNEKAKKERKESDRHYSSMRQYKNITFLEVTEVDVAIAKRAIGSRVSADSHGRNALELGEGIPEHAVVDVGVEVADVQRMEARNGGGHRRNNRHL